MVKKNMCIDHYRSIITFLNIDYLIDFIDPYDSIQYKSTMTTRPTNIVAINLLG